MPGILRRVSKPGIAVCRKLVLRDDTSVKLDCELLAALMDKYQKQSSFPADTKRDGWTLRKPAPDPANYLKVSMFTHSSNDK